MKNERISKVSPIIRKVSVMDQMPHTLQPTDEELVVAFQQGEERAFDELVKRYQHKVRLLCAHYLAESQEADDAAQEVFIRIYQHLAGFFPYRHPYHASGNNDF